MNATAGDWPRDSICLFPSRWDARSIAVEIDRRTCRVDFDSPGFCVVNLGSAIGSMGLSRLMVELKRELATIHESRNGATLVYQSAGRFDQQETTRLHLDGGPDECLLMLGYEPTAVDSEMEIADYARCAFDLGLSPGQFMAEYNPMFGRGADLLTPYITRLPCFSPSDYRVVCINNSCAPYSATRPAWQGVLHGATIPERNDSEARVIHSTMIAPAPVGAPDSADPMSLGE